MLFKKVEEILVLGHHYGVLAPSSLKNLVILGVAVSQPFNRIGFDAELCLNPRGQGGR